jgi:hypothetical protein
MIFRVSAQVEVDDGDLDHLARAIARALQNEPFSLEDVAHLIMDNDDEDQDDADNVQSEEEDRVVPPADTAAPRVAEISSHSSNANAPADSAATGGLTPEQRQLQANYGFIDRVASRKPLSERQVRALRQMVAYFDADPNAWHYRADWAADCGMTDMELGGVLGRLGAKFMFGANRDPLAHQLGAEISLSVALKFHREHDDELWQYQINPTFADWFKNTYPG